ncbi:hypothetical protein G7Y89_g2755 [Cudoniella acicularis]|uniref:Clr5 domain-containing protein n=1 Tax=Cudoniella acicularis TaxID=354080 RepID=A0A8H4RTI8_9HELO|nr:hypothetical protein G7Y89_g2755 [Cudoniella acicularis]
MEDLFLDHGGVLNLPAANNPLWANSPTGWLKVGLSSDPREHVATTRENQIWSSTHKRKAKLLEPEFHIKARWRRIMDDTLKCLKPEILFGHPGSQEWEAAVVKCLQLGCNTTFIEEVERRKNPNSKWTATIRKRVKTIEWEFHRRVLTGKYTEGPGKSLRRIVKEMFCEKGVKLSSDTLNERLNTWGVAKRPKPPTNFSAQNLEDLYTTALVGFSSSTATSVTFPGQNRAQCEEPAVDSFMSSLKWSPTLDPSDWTDMAPGSSPWDSESAGKDMPMLGHAGNAAFIDEQWGMNPGYYGKPHPPFENFSGDNLPQQILPCQGYSPPPVIPIGAETLIGGSSADNSFGFHYSHTALH